MFCHFYRIEHISIMDTSNTSFWLALKFGFILIGEWIRLHSNWLSNWACFWLALKLSFILIGWDCHFVSQISTFMKWLFFDKCEKVKLLPHQRNIYFYRLKFPIQKLDNDLGYFRKTFEAVHQAIRGSRTQDDMAHPDLHSRQPWSRGLGHMDGNG